MVARAPAWTVAQSGLPLCSPLFGRCEQLAPVGAVGCTAQASRGSDSNGERARWKSRREDARGEREASKELLVAGRVPARARSGEDASVNDD